MRDFWVHLGLAGGMIVIAAAIAKLVDARISRLQLAPEVATRYGVLRRTIFTVIVFLGVLSALLVIPQVRAIAGGILASSAVVGLVIGLAAQRTLGNFVAGLLIAFTQPVRLGDEIELEGTHGTVEEIGLTYTWVRTRDNHQLVIPNEKLASETIRNLTIRSTTTIAEVTVQLPLATDLHSVVDALEHDSTEVYVTGLDGTATIAVRRSIPDEHAVDREQSDLRLIVHDRLRALGVFG
jgi:small-conductance mechanosensitive channel